MVTIYDVAARAGVSPATVSRVFNGIKVSPDRVESVRRAAEELGFVPNRNARRLRTSSSEIIAMMIPDIENPFFTAMTRAVEDIARADGYSVMLCNTDEDLEREQDYLRAAVSDPVAGIIVVPKGNDTDLGLALARGVPVVCVDRHSGNQVDTVVAANLDGATEAAGLLFQAGYRRVACISGPEGVETADQRKAGWSRASLMANGQEPDSELLVRTRYTVAGGEAATQQLLALSEPPEAIFAANNRLAAGALRVLAERDLMPPKIGLVSFGGLPMVLLMPTDVIVTHLPSRSMGLLAAKMLLERIRGLKAPAREVILPVSTNPEDEPTSAAGSAEKQAI